MKKSEEIFWANMLLYALIGPIKVELGKAIVKHAYKGANNLFEE